MGNEAIYALYSRRIKGKRILAAARTFQEDKKNLFTRHESSIGKTSWQDAKESDLLINPGLSREVGQISLRVLSKTNYGTNIKRAPLEVIKHN